MSQENLYQLFDRYLSDLPPGLYRILFESQGSESTVCVESCETEDISKTQKHFYSFWELDMTTGTQKSLGTDLHDLADEYSRALNGWLKKRFV